MFVSIEYSEIYINYEIIWYIWDINHKNAKEYLRIFRSLISITKKLQSVVSSIIFLLDDCFNSFKKYFLNLKLVCLKYDMYKVLIIFYIPFFKH